MSLPSKRHVFLRGYSRTWYYMIDPDFGYVASSKPSKDCIVLRMKIMKRKSIKRYQGRRSYDHQPQLFMKVGWYGEYMADEWGVTKGRLRTMNRRLEKL